MAQTVVTIRVSGMDCDGCERSINTALARLEGVRGSEASHSAGTVQVRFDDETVDLGLIGKAIEDAGYEVQS